eukprot:TRINITY_DN1899_c0_g1_i1.p1 TRINITY_DN1899_c0_g1~~TRINITY_DN1899_c0_g1_i1.p1  ORF type:complete len:230 (+),score=41.91 TRINITY_DN1899_c0_g1_i1:64-753(+)
MRFYGFGCLLLLIFLNVQVFGIQHVIRGEWDLQVGKAKKAETYALEDMSDNFLNFTAVGDLLEALYIDTEQDKEMQIYISLSAWNAGQLTIVPTLIPEGNAETEQQWVINFEFHNRSKGHLVAQGKLIPDSEYYYQAVFLSGTSFFINIFLSDEVYTIVGNKRIHPAESTLFQKYGLIMMMGMFFAMQAFQNWLTPKLMPRVPPDQANPTGPESTSRQQQERNTREKED